jgi:hypothetical protein
MSDAAELDRLAGLVERVTFHNEQNGFCVLRLKVKGERELITLIGHTPVVSPGEYARLPALGHRSRARPAVSRGVRQDLAADHLTGIERYLGSGMVKGIGPVYAGKLVKAFGAAVFDVIEQSPNVCAKFPASAKSAPERSPPAGPTRRSFASIMVFLHAHGVSTSRAVRIFKTYGQAPSTSSRKTPTAWPRTFAASASSRPTRLPRRSASPRILPCAPRPVSPTRSPKLRGRATAVCPMPNWCPWR